MKKSIMLGNGFNMAIGVNTSYKALYEALCKRKFLKEHFLPQKEEIEGENYNLEKILSKYKTEGKKECIEYFLFESIVDKCRTVISTHSQLMTFLSGFNAFFTTNYDPLLYHNLLMFKEGETVDEKFKEDLREICKNKIQDVEIISLAKKDIYSIAKKIFEKEEKYKGKKRKEYMETLKDIKGQKYSIPIRDNFVINASSAGEKGKKPYKEWNSKDTSKQNIFYLHGALNIYREGQAIRKYITNSRKVDFINEIQRHSSDQFSNLSCVFQYSSDEKKKKIENNSYLKFCLKALSDLDGELTIIGWSADENDKHLKQAISESKISKIIFYYFNTEPKCLSFGEKEIEKLSISKLEWVVKKPKGSVSLDFV